MSEGLNKKYSLVHVVSAEEYFTPLVQTQVFEQAFLQQSLSGSDGPQKTAVWVPLSARHFFSSQFRNYRKELRKRFVGIKIVFIPGIDRLNNFPRFLFVLVKRAVFGSVPVIFHFRSEKHLKEFRPLKDFFRTDKFVADIRGIWAAERLLLDGIEVWDFPALMKNENANQIVHQMRLQLANADGVSAVSENLLNLVQSLSHEVKQGWVVPCSSNVPDQLNENYFEEKRQLKINWKIPAEGLVIGYLGGTAPYQNLDDMVLPLMKKCLMLNNRIHIVIITHEIEKMKKLVEHAGIELAKLSIHSLPQQQVSKYLKVFDLGLLVRHENLVNSVAQPVKLGEYLAAGVPVCVEGNIGGFAKTIGETKAGVIVSIARHGIEKAAEDCIDYLDNTSEKERVENALMVAKEKFSWKKNLLHHRLNYKKLLVAE